MPRLIRPAIPLVVQLRVLLRQLGELFPDLVVGNAEAERGVGLAVYQRKEALAAQIGCDVKDLNLDHDPPLGARQKVFDRDGNHVDYIPPANDPDHLLFRAKPPQYNGSHLIKTNVRGDHGQFPDRVLIKRNRRLERREAEAAGLAKPKRKTKIQGRSSFPKGRKFITGRKMKSRPFSKREKS